jgi:hypothetical protein
MAGHQARACGAALPIQVLGRVRDAAGLRIHPAGTSAGGAPVPVEQQVTGGRGDCVRAGVGIGLRRWNLIGLLAFAAAQATIGAAGALAATQAHAWPAIGRFFTTLSAAGLAISARAVALLTFGADRGDL